MPSVVRAESTALRFAVATMLVGHPGLGLARLRQLERLVVRAADEDLVLLGLRDLGRAAVQGGAQRLGRLAAVDAVIVFTDDLAQEGPLAFVVGEMRVHHVPLIRSDCGGAFARYDLADHGFTSTGAVTRSWLLARLGAGVWMCAGTGAWTDAGTDAGTVAVTGARAGACKGARTGAFAGAPRGEPPG